MFNIAPTEMILVAIVALIVIGPKDLPKAMRFVGHWVGRARGIARQFRSGFDSMIREAELQDMEKRWAAENERIMREHTPNAHPMLPMTPAVPSDPSNGTADGGATPALVTPPAIASEPASLAPANAAGAAHASDHDSDGTRAKP